MSDFDVYFTITCVVVTILVAVCWRLWSYREVKDTERWDHSNWANGHKSQQQPNGKVNHGSQRQE